MLNSSSGKNFEKVMILSSKERKMKKTIRKYSVCSAAIVLATMASLGTAGNVRAEDYTQLESYPDPAELIEDGLGDHEVRHYLHTLRRFMQTYLQNLEQEAKKGGPAGPMGPAGPRGERGEMGPRGPKGEDRKSTRLNSSHANISYAVFCL